MLKSYISNFLLCYIFLFLFENCLFIPNDKITNTLDFSQAKEISKRGIKDMNELKLDLPIKYHVIPGANKKMIEKVLKYISKETCIKFEEEEEFFTTEGFLFILDTESKVSDGPTLKNMSQPIPFNKKCNRSFGCLLNLVGHALGLGYTHNRPDRDKFIRIYRNNFEFYEYEIFKKKPQQNVLTFNTTYDYGSLMHEGQTFMSMGKKVIISSNTVPYYNFMMGQRYHFSFNDIKILNYYYCSDKCENKKKIKCYNGGYPDPNKCNKCKCPNGYSSKKSCSGKNKPSKKCGKTMLKATHKLNFIEASGKTKCTYHIKAEKDKHIRFTIENVNTTISRPCFQKMGLEVKFLRDKGAVGLCLCGNYEKLELITQDNHLMVEYKGKSKKHGFKISYREMTYTGIKV
uniref:Metalloendopeptidase n=1 Tax=Strongyloides stercoralis TaxID=6248 RepID=A0A0K0DZB0_STRER